MTSDDPRMAASGAETRDRSRFWRGILGASMLGLGGAGLACGVSHDATSLTPRSCPSGAHSTGPGNAPCVADAPARDAGDAPEVDASLPGADSDASVPLPEADGSVPLPDGGAFCPDDGAELSCDARAYSPATRACALGPLAERCPGDACPTLGQAVDSLRAGVAFVVVRRPCHADDGTALISVGSSIGTGSGAYVYDAASGALLALQWVSDYDAYCGNRTELGYYGRFFADCGFAFPDSLPDDCSDRLPFNADAGLLPEACVVISE